MAKQSGAGGGIHSNKVREVGVRTGKAAMGIRPGYPDNLGNMRGTHVTRGGIEGGGGDLPSKLTPMGTVKPSISVPLGNAVATNVGGGGPGAGRTIYKTGMQKQYGAAVSNRPAPQGPDPLAPWFPNSPARQSPIKK
jgi:hypothetical protein